jgi:DNA-binding beta-propeller fold protein YncE
VSNDSGGSFSVINVTSDEVTRSLTLGFTQPIGIAYNPSNKMMYVDDAYYNGYGAVYVFNARNFSLVKKITSKADFNYLWDIAYNPINKMMYLDSEFTGKYGSGTVIMINGTTITGVIQLPSNSSPGGIVFNPANGLIYVANGLLGTLSLINGTRILRNQVSLDDSSALTNGLVVG